MTETHPAAGPAGQDTHATSGPKEVGGRQKQYMVGRRLTSGVSTLAAGPGPSGSKGVLEILQAQPDIDVVRVVKPAGSGGLQMLAAGSSDAHDIVVIRTSSVERAAELDTLGLRNPALIVERDHLLKHLGNFKPQFLDTSRSPTQITTAPIFASFRVQDDGGQGIANATIVVYGEFGNEDQGQTDAQGNLTIGVNGGNLNMTAALYVKPAANYWERFVERPALDARNVNKITLQPLASYRESRFSNPAPTGPAFIGWGQRVMGVLGLDPRQDNGAGARIAIIDSGCDTSHPALSHIMIGRDYTNLQDHQPDENTWRDDTIHHGTHCAGVIAGNGNDGHIRGFAPQAEIHVLKVFPGGAFNNLAAAINYCIEKQIHVVNCSLGGDVTSDLVVQAILRARQSGVALFVAAGNSGTAVQFPAVVPGVMCVSAIGQAGNFPDYTYHARTVPDGASVAPGQVFPAKFTCHGPQVGVCGPGVGIISTVPGGYAAWDGTSMADPHLTGLGALVAAHHPQMRSTGLRDAAWVDRLFQLVIGAAQFVGLPQDYGGAGLPLASTLLGSNNVATQSAALSSRQFNPDAIADLVKAVVNALPQDGAAPRRE
jgi:subtilisin family serine protease